MPSKEYNNADTFWFKYAVREMWEADVLFYLQQLDCFTNHLLVNESAPINNKKVRDPMWVRKYL